jgi:hypothetical protein
VVGPRLSRSRLGPADDLPAPVERYLHELGSALPGRSARKAAILAEVADGLMESVDARRDEREDRNDAASSAVAEFGPARELAVAFVREMAGSAAHRVGLALVVSGPIVGLAWLTAFAIGSGRHWLDELPTVLGWLPGYALLMLAVIVSAVVAFLAGQGPAVRHLPIGPREAAAAATLAAVGCVAVDALLLTHLARLAVDGVIPLGLASVPALLSLGRSLLALAAARRCIEFRAALRVR